MEFIRGGPIIMGSEIKKNEGSYFDLIPGGQKIGFSLAPEPI